MMHAILRAMQVPIASVSAMIEQLGMAMKELSPPFSCLRCAFLCRQLTHPHMERACTRFHTSTREHSLFVPALHHSCVVN